MEKRSKRSQSLHDIRVKHIAAGYKGQGWKVKADIRGYPAPRLIFGRQPDVIAVKGKRMIIVEVETKSSMKKDISQRNAFKKFAALSKYREFRVNVV